MSKIAELAEHSVNLNYSTNFLYSINECTL